MIIPLSSEPPRTRDEIARELRRVHRESVAYWGGFTTAAFLEPLGSSWSPGDTVRHLTKAIRGVTRGLAMPRLMLWVTFGPARRSSRDYDQVRTTYLAALAAGGQAGRFAPRPRPAIPQPEEWRALIMSRHEVAATALVDAVERWNEKSLDRFRLPHPILGRLTVREMLFFTLYHNLHHVHVVARKVTPHPV